MWIGLTEIGQTQFWISVVEIIWINVLLSGDNAIVIALACRNLPPKQRFSGTVLGTIVALLLRFVFAAIVSTLMVLPYLKIVGGATLLWIAVKLIVPSESDTAEDAASGGGLWQAVKLVAVADVVMSLDNVIAVAGAANGNYALLVFGLGISVPAIVAGATIIMKILDRFPIIVWAGAALLGWIGGDMIATDPVIAGWSGPVMEEWIRFVASNSGAAGTALAGFLWKRARRVHAAKGEE
jgi:YjbE family integral membrane protein